MKKLKRFELKHLVFIGVLFVSTLGILLHFCYEWSGRLVFLGFFCPVSESTWEHMKLVYFPTLVYLLFMRSRLRQEFPSFAGAAAASLLLGTLAVPALFYTYTGILGYNLLALDIGVFFLSVILEFYFLCKFLRSETTARYTLLLVILAVAAAIAFIVFTYNPPALALFSNPEGK